MACKLYVHIKLYSYQEKEMFKCSCLVSGKKNNKYVLVTTVLDN